MTKPQILNHSTEVKVRFNEVDSLGIVWHGHYIKYFEDGREAFGKKYGLGYMDVYRNDFATPIVNVNVDFKKTVAYEDVLIVETTFVNSPAAKIHFTYIIYRKSNLEVVATGSTTQVFFTLQKKLHITNPPFYSDWKKKNLAK